MTTTTTTPQRPGRTRVQVGQMCITPAARDLIDPLSILTGLRRHIQGDWGELCDEDWDMNELAMIHGRRLLSVYHSPEGHCFWIITEADRSSTTVLLPTDY